MRKGFCIHRLDAVGTVLMSGMLVVINYELYIIPDEQVEDFTSGPKILIGNGLVIFAIAKRIPTLGGGDGLFFHRVRVIGSLDDAGACIYPSAISVQNRPSEEFLEIELENLDQFKNEYEQYIKMRDRPQSGDWLDFYVD